MLDVPTLHPGLSDPMTAASRIHHFLTTPFSSPGRDGHNTYIFGHGHTARSWQDISGRTWYIGHSQAYWFQNRSPANSVRFCCSIVPSLWSNIRCFVSPLLCEVQHEQETSGGHQKPCSTHTGIALLWGCYWVRGHGSRLTWQQVEITSPKPTTLHCCNSPSTHILSSKLGCLFIRTALQLPSRVSHPSKEDKRG